MEALELMSVSGKLPNSEFWSGKRVLLTGHTGFKGSWCALWLKSLGAQVTGFGLESEHESNLFELAKVSDGCHSLIGDLRNLKDVRAAVEVAKPQIVLHMAAQALVKQSFADPMGTWETNLGGTLNLLETLRDQDGLEVVLVVTTDKVYANDGTGKSFVEADPLGGKDPYSASKAATEIAVASHALNYLADIPVATARGGNVIGGGDFSNDRLAPDCVRAALSGQPVVLRQPTATRPWQHVLDCLCGYLLFVEKLMLDPTCPRALNIGPSVAHELPVVRFTKCLLSSLGVPDLLEIQEEQNSREAPKLALDTCLARKTLSWNDRLSGEAAIDATAKWYKLWQEGKDMRQQTIYEIRSYEGLK